MPSSSLKYSVTFALLACVLALSASTVSAQFVSVVCVAAAVGMLIVSVAYCVRNPQLLGKRVDGRLSPALSALLWAYHLLNHLSFACVRICERVQPYGQVAPSLYLGRRLTSSEAATLPVEFVLDLTSEFHETSALRAKGYCSVPMLDGVSPNLCQFDRAITWLRESAARGPTYVHCALGHGRSAAVVAAYLVATQQASSLDEALALVQTARPGARLSRSSRTLIARWLNGPGDTSFNA